VDEPARGLDAVRVAPREGAHLEVLADGERREEPPSLRDLDEPPRDDRVRGDAGERLAAEPDRPGRRAEEAADRPERRRLPGAVRPEEGDDLARLDAEVDAVERLDGAVAGAKPLDGQAHASSSSPAPR